MAMLKPKLEDFADADGYIDYYEYDMAEDQWRSQFPNLYEKWCGDPAQMKPPSPAIVEDDSLAKLLEALAA